MGATAPENFSPQFTLDILRIVFCEKMNDFGNVLVTPFSIANHQIRQHFICRVAKNNITVPPHVLGILAEKTCESYTSPLCLLFCSFQQVSQIYFQYLSMIYIIYIKCYVVYGLNMESSYFSGKPDKFYGKLNKVGFSKTRRTRFLQVCSLIKANIET